MRNRGPGDSLQSLPTPTPPAASNPFLKPQEEGFPPPHTHTHTQKPNPFNATQHNLVIQTQTDPVVSEKIGIWVPLYVDEISGEYAQLIRSVEGDRCLKDSFHGTVLTGPDSGPPKTKDDDEFYRPNFEKLAATQQWTTFGYVTTDYGRRPIAEVLNDIRIWLTPGSAGYGDYVQGIWVDNAAKDFKDAKNVDYYGKVIDYINEFGKMVALNPGTNVGDCSFLEAKKVAFVNSFENTHAVWSAAAAANDPSLRCPCSKGATRCIASIHSYPERPSTTQVSGTMGQLTSRGYDAAFLTDRAMPKHYSALPSLWQQVVVAACQSQIGGTVSEASNTPARRLLMGGAGGPARA